MDKFLSCTIDELEYKWVGEIQLTLMTIKEDYEYIFWSDEDLTQTFESGQKVEVIYQNIDIDSHCQTWIQQIKPICPKISKGISWSIW